MSRHQGISIRGLYESDPTLFDDMVIPSIVIEGETKTIDKDILINSILMDLDEFEILYPNAPQMKYNLKWWSNKNLANWNLLLRALLEDYDPLHNYDRTEEKQEDENGQQAVVSGDNSTGNNKHLVSGYDSPTLVDSTKDETSMQSTANSNSTNNILRNYTLRAYGNIGVTTSQQMLEAEMKLRQNYNIYDLIVMDFKDKFCLTIY